MKLDKIGFAKVVAFVCGRTGYNLAHTEIEELDSLIDIDAPVPEAIYPKHENVDRLMTFMAGGTHKIDAIREYRALTGMGLKESKDAVEKYWNNSADAKLLARIRQALGTNADGDMLVEVAKNAYRNSEELASQHNANPNATLGDILGKVNIVHPNDR